MYILNTHIQENKYIEKHRNAVDESRIKNTFLTDYINMFVSAVSMFLRS